MVKQEEGRDKKGRKEGRHRENTALKKMDALQLFNCC
jgi:hypothetical protein